MPSMSAARKFFSKGAFKQRNDENRLSRVECAGHSFYNAGGNAPYLGIQPAFCEKRPTFTSRYGAMRSVSVSV
jgi:hypothetical protein